MKKKAEKGYQTISKYFMAEIANYSKDPFLCYTIGKYT